MALLVNLMRGMECTCPAVLPSCHIGSTANEMTGPNVILRPYRRKENQCVMNRQQSTSISGKPHPENHKGEGNRAVVGRALCPCIPGSCASRVEDVRVMRSGGIRGR